MEITEVAQLISHGGVVALALVVWYELRIHRAELKSTREVIASIGNTLAKILERDRDREVREFIREEISGVHDSPQLPELAESARARGDRDDDDTPVDSPRGEYRHVVKKRAATEPGQQGPRRDTRPRVQIPRKPTPKPSDDPGDDVP